MGTTSLIGIVVAIVIVLIVVGLLVRVGRRRKVEADRTKANELRQEGERTQLMAREQEANAASVDAKAGQARVEVEKLDREAAAKAQGAQVSRERAQKHHEQAAELDPDTDTDAHPEGGLKEGEREQEDGSTGNERN